MVSDESTPTKRLRSAVKKMIQYVVDLFTRRSMCLTIYREGVSSPGPSRPRGGSKRSGVIRRMDKKMYSKKARARFMLVGIFVSIVPYTYLLFVVGRLTGPRKNMNQTSRRNRSSPILNC